MGMGDWISWFLHNYFGHFWVYAVCNLINWITSNTKKNTVNHFSKLQYYCLSVVKFNYITNKLNISQPGLLKDKFNSSGLCSFKLNANTQRTICNTTLNNSFIYVALYTHQPTEHIGCYIKSMIKLGNKLTRSTSFVRQTTRQTDRIFDDMHTNARIYTRPNLCFYISCAMHTNNMFHARALFACHNISWIDNSFQAVFRRNRLASVETNKYTKPHPIAPNSFINFPVIKRIYATLQHLLASQLTNNHRTYAHWTYTHVAHHVYMENHM